MNQTSFIGSAEILEGGVQIVHNRNLSYAPWINWQDIVRDSDAHIQIQNNGRRGLCILDWVVIDWVCEIGACHSIRAAAGQMGALSRIVSLCPLP